MKISYWTRIIWFVTSVVADFGTAWFVMMFVGALGGHWNYWHAWWVTFTGLSVSGATLTPILVRLEYLIERS